MRADEHDYLVFVVYILFCPNVLKYETFRSVSYCTRGILIELEIVNADAESRVLGINY